MDFAHRYSCFAIVVPVLGGWTNSQLAGLLPLEVCALSSRFIKIERNEKMVRKCLYTGLALAVTNGLKEFYQCSLFSLCTLVVKENILVFNITNRKIIRNFF